MKQLETLEVRNMQVIKRGFHNSQFTIYNSQFTDRNLQFKMQNSHFTIHVSQFTIHKCNLESSVNLTLSVYFKVNVLILTQMSKICSCRDVQYISLYICNIFQCKCSNLRCQRSDNVFAGMCNFSIKLSIFK